jgi:hypothetical protein
MFLNRCLAAQIAGALLVLPAAAQVVAARQHAPVRIHERRFDGTVTSENWSGYAVLGAADSVTDAKGSWTVPAVTCSESRHSSSAYSSFWVGIDGYSSSTVEQTGTDSDCSGGEPTYYAWYEFYPNPSFEVTSLTIKPGDTISAEVSYSNGEFTATITDVTTGRSFSTSAQVPSAQRSSAEWIAEAPSSCTRRSCEVLPLADFGTVDFGGDYTGVSSTCYATVSGVSAAIGSFGTNVSEITMVTNSGADEAIPSGFSAADGSSFTVTWK